MTPQHVLIDGRWQPSSGKTFQATNPATREMLPDSYPLSPWSEVEAAIQAAHRASVATRGWPGERFARFLERYAERIEAKASELVEMAHKETALAKEPRLGKVELPRTINQLKLAAAAARDGSWVQATIDKPANIRSMFGPIGPVVVFGPNNFPFAFNGISGGDFAAAVAAGNPVIAKGHSSHPGTTRLFAVEAAEAARETEMPSGFVQLIYRTSHADGEKLVSHPWIGACGYTGARQTGLVLKAAADRVGKPIYLELSSINPVFFLPGALQEKGAALLDEFVGSSLMGTGQFCTNPGLIVLIDSAESRQFIEGVAAKFNTAPVTPLLGEGVLQHLSKAVSTIQSAGAKVLAGGEAGGGNGFCFRNTLLSITADQFLANPEAMQTEAFGNASLFVTAKDASQLTKIAEHLEGNLTGAIYSAADGRDDALYNQIVPELRKKVGRLLNDKMPTGVAVSPAMNHGGPFPSTGHPGFTAVGIPASLHRFAMLECYDAVRPHRLPPALQDKNPTGKLWRSIGGTWTQADAS